MTTSKARPKASRPQSQRKTHKWADLQKEAERRAEGRGTKRLTAEPFVIDDVEPHIVIEPPDEKTTLIISEQIGIVSSGLDPNLSIQRILPLLRAFCGGQFPRVWAMLPTENTTEAVYVLMQALLDHFEVSLRTARDAAELPGGSEASSD
jgi:hypothetical protein